MDFSNYESVASQLANRLSAISSVLGPNINLSFFSSTESLISMQRQYEALANSLGIPYQTDWLQFAENMRQQIASITGFSPAENIVQNIETVLDPFRIPYFSNIAKSLNGIQKPEDIISYDLSSLTSLTSHISIEDDYVAMPEELISNDFVAEEKTSFSNESVTPRKKVSFSDAIVIIGTLIQFILFIIGYRQTQRDEQAEQQRHEEKMAMWQRDLDIREKEFNSNNSELAPYYEVLNQLSPILEELSDHLAAEEADLTLQEAASFPPSAESLPFSTESGIDPSPVVPATSSDAAESIQPDVKQETHE